MKRLPLPTRTCALFSGVVIALAGCKRPAPPAAGPVPVYAAPVEVRTVPITRTAVGLIEPLHTVALQSQVSGVIAKIHFTEGDEVAAGALLITLDQRPFQNALRSAQAGLAEARAAAGKATADATRYNQLHTADAISDAEYSQYTTAATAASSAVAVQEAAVAAAQLDLDYTEIRAPFAGRTSRLALREGSLVKANDSAQPLLILNEMAPIGASFALPESDLPAVRASLAAGTVKVTATPQGEGVKAAPGQLDFINNTVGPTTGTVAMRARFENADRSLWPGQFVTLVLALGELPDALVVPATAIVAGQQGDQIFVVKPDHTIDVRPVHSGITDGNLIVVRDAVKAGETVVTDGQLRLLPGTKVMVRDRNAPSAAPVTAAKTTAPAPTQP